MLHASAPLPRASPHSGHPINRAAYHLALAQRAPDARLREREYTKAWRLAEPVVLVTLRRRLGDRELVDEALSAVALKLWRVASSGNTRVEHGGLIRTITSNAIADTYAARERNERDISIDTISEWSEDRAQSEWRQDADAWRSSKSQSMERAIVAEEASNDPSGIYEQLAATAEAPPYNRPKWAAVLREMAGGETRRDVIAKSLGMEAHNVRRALYEIRGSGLLEHYAPQPLRRDGGKADAFDQLRDVPALSQLSLFEHHLDIVMAA